MNYTFWRKKTFFAKNVFVQSLQETLYNQHKTHSQFATQNSWTYKLHVLKHFNKTFFLNLPMKRFTVIRKQIKHRFFHTEILKKSYISHLKTALLIQHSYIYLEKAETSNRNSRLSFPPGKEDTTKYDNGETRKLHLCPVLSPRSPLTCSWQAHFFKSFHFIGFDTHRPKSRTQTQALEGTLTEPVDRFRIHSFHFLEGKDIAFFILSIGESSTLTLKSRGNSNKSSKHVQIQGIFLFPKHLEMQKNAIGSSFFSNNGSKRKSIWIFIFTMNNCAFTLESGNLEIFHSPKFTLPITIIHFTLSNPIYSEKCNNANNEFSITKHKLKSQIPFLR